MRELFKPFFCSFLLSSILTSVTAQKKVSTAPTDKLKQEAIVDIEGKYAEYKKIALQIWDYAEVGYKEVKSSALHQQTLRDNGFIVHAGVTELETSCLEL